MSDSKKDSINRLASPSRPVWRTQDETLLAELLARRSEFREKQDAAIAKFLNQTGLAEIYGHWPVLEENADEVIDLLKPFSHLSSSSVSFPPFSIKQSEQPEQSEQLNGERES